MKKTLLLIVVLCFAICFPLQSFASSPSLENFIRVNQYEQGHFVDIDDVQWYAVNVKSAYEFGLFVGSGDKFNPDGNISLAETLAVACRLHNVYFGNEHVLTEESPWYKVYVDYAIENDIIGANEYSDYSAKATRAQFASILSKCVEDGVYNVQNIVEDGMIPDVDMGAPYAQDVYKLYRSGILVGNDAQGTFTPNSNIKRSAVAAIVTRIVDPSLRENITLERIHAQSISISSSVLTLTVGDSVKLDATVIPSGFVENLSWISDNPSIVSVDSNGVVIANAKGSATVTVSTSNGLAQNCEITVMGPVTAEYRVALEKARSYSNSLYMSKQGIYDQLTSFVEGFPEDAAQYAVENLNADYNANALKKAKDYSDSLYMSKQGIYDQLTSPYGEKFTESEAKYAIDNLVTDYNRNALEKAKSYRSLMNMSNSAIYEQLISPYGEKFTESEAQYAIEHLDD